jgi:hypothetical protein
MKFLIKIFLLIVYSDLCIKLNSCKYHYLFINNLFINIINKKAFIENLNFNYINTGTTNSEANSWY